MNVALITLPGSESLVVPPLTLAYVATVLEQRRHIVRIYDLALKPDIPLTVALRPLRAFCPQVIVLAGDRLSLLEDALEVLREQHSCVIPMRLNRDGLEAGFVCADILALIDRQSGNDTSTIIGRDTFHLQHDTDLDRLPFPARHLLSLEDYGLRAVGNELQTTLLVGAPSHRDSERVILRSPAQIVAELRSVSREYGIRHYLLTGVILTADLGWLHELLTRLCDADLGIGWEASVDVEPLDEALLNHMDRAGCETLRLNLNVARVFESVTARIHLTQTVSYAHQFGIYVRADLELEPPYEAIPHLVDVAATFGLDDVNFSIRADKASDKIVTQRTVDDLCLEAMARELYDAGRSRQRLIDQFGPKLGPIIWKVCNSRLISGMLTSNKRPAGLGEQEDLAGSA